MNKVIIIYGMYHIIYHYLLSSLDTGITFLGATKPLKRGVLKLLMPNRAIYGGLSPYR